MEQGKYICDLPIELLWQTGMILYLLKRPFKIDMIDENVCRFYINMDVETAREMLTLLKREIKEERLDIILNAPNYCYTAPCALLRKLRKTVESSGWRFSAEAVDSDTCHIFTDMEPDDFMKALSDAQEAKRTGLGGALIRRLRRILGLSPNQQTDGIS